MLSEQMIFKPAYEYKDDGIEHGVLSKFNPRTTILKAGTQLHPEVSPLKHDIKYLQDVGVKMRDGITIYIDIYLPPDLKPEERVPVLIAWNPNGKTAENCSKIY